MSMQRGFRIGLVVIGMTAAVIDTNDGPAWARKTVCDTSLSKCIKRCRGVFESSDRQIACGNRCYDTFVGCVNKEAQVNQQPKAESPPSTPPTGQGPRRPVSVDPNQPGGTATPEDPGSPPKKPKVGIGKGDIGVFSQPTTSGGGTPIQRTQSGKKK